MFTLEEEKKQMAESYLSLIVQMVATFFLEVLGIQLSAGKELDQLTFRVSVVSYFSDSLCNKG